MRRRTASACGRRGKRAGGEVGRGVARDRPIVRVRRRVRDPHVAVGVPVTRPIANPGPCADCGGPKTPGKGSRLCSPCRVARKEVRYEVQSERITRPHAPCLDCGGPKVPEGVKARQGQKVCEACRLVRKEKDRVRRAERHRLTYKPKPKVRRTPKPVAAKPARVSLSSSTRLVVPKEIESAWGRASSGSQFRKLCPTRKDLVARYGVTS